MAEVTLTINGRNYGISCDDGQEQRVLDLGAYVDQRMKEMASAGAATSDSQLLVLTTILLTDEIFELRDQVSTGANAPAPTTNGAHPPESEDHAELTKTIENLSGRVDTIAERLQGA